ncbi:MAG: NADH-quinone oxidoreductase subunit L [Bacillota bacterium]
MTGMQIFIMMVVMPAVLSLVILVLPKKLFALAASIAIAALAIVSVVAIMNFGTEMVITLPWLGFGIDFSLRLDMFSSFSMLAASAFALIVAIYSASYLREKPYAGRFFFYYLLTIAFANGALMSNNLVLMLFFWEGLLVLLFGMLLVSGRHSIRTAVKALVLNGAADLCLILGVAITGWLAGSLAMDAITPIPVEGIAILGFIMVMFGAIGKSGSMPFHSWIPDAAEDAPLPFMALLPGSLEKILGIYLLVRIVLELYRLLPGSTMSIFMMVIGGLTIIFAVMMALAQKNYTKMLSYHAISQVGYMVIGIGSALPIGIIGGIFHMINHALYKTTLFLTAGNIKKQTGSDDLDKLGGLSKFMPITTIFFIVAALAACGVPPLNGFFSKELLLDSSWETGWFIYIVGLVGAFLTTALFMKIGHAAYFGKPTTEKLRSTKEAGPMMIIPMIIPAIFCIIFGLNNKLPISKIIEPILGVGVLQGQSFSGWPASVWMAILSVAVIIVAVLWHFYGVKRGGGNPAASFDHVRYAPVFRTIYDLAEQRYFDPYNILMVVIKVIALIGYGIDRGLNWIYDTLFTKVYGVIGKELSQINDGDQSRYIQWAIGGLVIIAIVFIVVM